MIITLAMESAIAGGSVSLLDGSVEIANWVGSSDVSKAEDLLPNIDRLLKDSSLTSKDIGQIAVSAGPGSFTGIRICLATALGLKKGHGVSLATVSALDAIAVLSGDNNVSVAVPMGRNTVCLQQFENCKSLDEPHTLEHEQFVDRLQQDVQNKYVVHEKLYSDTQQDNVINFGSNIAKAVGLFAIKNPNTSIAPLFISKSSS
jgi:tRNA threonylcarbamoyl adenosine modification protein YeaZ